MGFHFYIKSILTVTLVTALVWLTWYKTTEVVHEVVDFQSKLDQHTWFTSQSKVHENLHVNEINNESNVKLTDSLTTAVASSATMSIETTTANTIDTTATIKVFSSLSSSAALKVTTIASTTQSRSTPSMQSQATIFTPEANAESAEKRHVAFLKVHKTGSSTVQNIFLRFGDSRNLTFILAHDDVALAETKFPNVISYQNSLTDKNVAPPPEGRYFEILCCHVIYNRTQFQKFLPKDTAYIGLVREPVARLESSFRYFNLYPTANLSEFAANPFHYDKGLHSMSNNRMAFEFGYPLCLFPNSKEKPKNLQQAIEEYTSKLLTEFDLIMVNERMDESLVLLKRVLNWHTKDIIYMKQLVAKHETRRFTESDIKNLKFYLYLDFALYERALFEFRKRIELLGDDFLEEVNHFKEVKEKVHSFCSNKGDGILSFPESKWDSAFNVTRNDCYMYTKFEIKFIQDIRMKMYGKVGI